MTEKTIFVVGAGKGCGNHVAKRFGREGFKVILMSRNQKNLDGYAKEFRDEGIDVATATIDVSDSENVTEAFDGLKKQYGIPDVLFYNVGITTADSELPGKDSELLVDRYRVDVAGAFHAIQQIIGPEFEEKNGTILVTGGGLAMYPMYEYLPLSMDKAALRAMCIALHNAFIGKGVFVGTVTVTDVIAPGGKCDPALLAEDSWSLYTKRDECEIIH